MTKLAWDQVGERFYEAGVDQGVLYLSDGTVVPWNGLLSVDQEGEESTTPVHIDGVKILDIPAISEYTAKLSAYTYPDEFLPLEGFQTLGDGLGVDGQPIDTFGLSYRTRIANDVDGTEIGYRIHIVYNLTAVPDDVPHTTLSDQASLTPFAWSLESVPVYIPGYFPTAHAVIDSTKANHYLLNRLEEILYGTDSIMIPILDGNEDDYEIDSGFIDPDDYGLDGNEDDPIDDPILDGNLEDGEIEGDVPELVDPDPLDGGNPFSKDTEGGEPYLPPLDALTVMVENFSPLTVVYNGDGTLTFSGPDEFMHEMDPTTWVLEEVDADYKAPDRYRVRLT